MALLWKETLFYLFIYLFIYLAALSLSCGMRDLLVAACGIFSCGMQGLFLVAAHGLFSCGMWTLSWGMWDLVPWPGTEPGPPELGVRSLSLWTTREALEGNTIILILRNKYLRRRRLGYLESSNLKLRGRKVGGQGVWPSLRASLLTSGNAAEQGHERWGSDSRESHELCFTG